MKQKEKWLIWNKKADFESISDNFRLDPVTVRLLANRGVSTKEAAERFLSEDLSQLHDPALLKDGERAAELLTEALNRGERVAIASDYDTDGICAGQILRRGLAGLGFTAKVFTPDRTAEGYGLNERIVREAADFGAGLLITCDNGISAGEATGLAGALGMTVIVTDHHEVPREITEDHIAYILPPADAIVDPKQEDCSYPFKDICGAVVAFKLMQLLYRRLGRDQAETEALIPFAAIATVADVMDLLDENRVLVRRGLRMLECTDNLGLKALIRACGLEGKRLTAFSLGFVLGPCFNAAGRLETAEMAERLLDAEDGVSAERYAAELLELNQTRKNLTLEGYRQALCLIEEKNWARDKVMVVHLPDCHESIAGIIAGRLKEEYHRPALVFTGNGEQCKGSGRSVEVYNMFEHLSRCKELFSRFGGHPMAAGFSAARENIDVLRERLNRECELSEEDFCPVVHLDAVLEPEYVNESRIREWESLGPFGKGNPEPLFGQTGLRVLEARVLGQKRNVVRMSFLSGAGNAFTGILFTDGDRFGAYIDEAFGEGTFERLEKRQTQVRMAFTFRPEINEFNGRRSIQFNIQNFQAV